MDTALQHQHKNDGFTILEVVLVLVLIGIFSVIAIYRHSATDATLVAPTEVLKSHLRYAQARAINTEIIWGIQYDGTNYWLFKKKAGINPETKLLPGENTLLIDLSKDGISILEGSTGSFRVSFDEWGRPCSDTNCQNLLNSNMQLNISKDFQTPRQIIITKNTGFIP